MLQIDNQLITLVVVIICVIICFRTSSTILCAIIGAVIMSLINSRKNGESLINFDSLLKGIKKTPIPLKPIVNKEKPREKFYVDNNNYIKILSDRELEDKIETEMNIEIGSNRIKEDILEKEKPFIKESIPEEFIPKESIPKESIPKELYITREDVETECATDNVIDGDESIAYNSIHRNEPTRVILGMGKAYQNLSRYVLEEVEEIEGKEWWGNNEY